MIDIRCQYCNKLHCRVSKDFDGVVQFRCQRRHCQKINSLSLAIILQPQQKPATIHAFPAANVRA